MPDVERKTISASQCAALFGVSPYLTRRALFDFFHDHVDIDAKSNRRMDFGKYIEPYILARTADKFALEVTHNKKQEYTRHKSLPFGCTRDADIRCPTRGPGIIEAKSISYMTFRDSWTGSKAPLHIEAQLQEQLLVTGAAWGVIAAMIGADEDWRFFERYPDKKVFERLTIEGKQFFADVKAHRRPPVFGHPVEMRGLEALYPEAKKGVIYDAPKDAETGDFLRRYHYHRQERLFHGKCEDDLKIKILDVAKDASEMRCYGADARIVKKKVDPMEEARKRGGHTRTSIFVTPRDDVGQISEEFVSTWGAG